jgi:Ca2+/Na+ antiporter
LIWFPASLAACVLLVLTIIANAPFKHGLLVTTGEVVALLQSFGYMFDVPAALLGQTALAWGNSVGDAFANAALARQGQTKMAITGCFAAPLFNVLCGFGAALLVECIKGTGDR